MSGVTVIKKLRANCGTGGITSLPNSLSCNLSSGA
ncbi:hypothetical protein ACP4OV_018886 [Aristida adscensionis]